MIGLKLPALFVVVVGLGGCVIPFEDGRMVNERRSGEYNDAGSARRDEPQRYERRQFEDQPFEERGERQRLQQR